MKLLMFLGIPIAPIVIILTVITALFVVIDRCLFEHLMLKTNMITFKNNNSRHMWFYIFNFLMMYLPCINILYFILLICLIEIDNLTKYHI